jgi:hypothetical protein
VSLALLGGLAYPTIGRGQSRFVQITSDHLTRISDHLRVACDLMVLFYIFDHFTDKVDGNGARVYAEVVVDALRNPHTERPPGETTLGEITRQ